MDRYRVIAGGIHMLEYVNTAAENGYQVTSFTSVLAADGTIHHSFLLEFNTVVYHEPHQHRVLELDPSAEVLDTWARQSWRVVGDLQVVVTPGGIRIFCLISRKKSDVARPWYEEQADGDTDDDVDSGGEG